MDKNKAIKLFESLQSLGFKYFSSFGKLSIAAVFKNEIGNSYFLKIIYNKRPSIYVIDVKENEILIYSNKITRKELHHLNFKSPSFKSSVLNFEYDFYVANKIDDVDENLEEPKHLSKYNLCNENHKPYREKHPLIEGGIDISSKARSNSGTLGGVFRDYDDNFYGISNRHVLKIMNDGEQYYNVLHPGDSGRAANANKENIGQIIEKSLDYQYDIALFKISIELHHKCINSTRDDKVVFDGFGKANFNDDVTKCGRSSNTTLGKVISTHCATFFNNKIYYKNQLLLSCMAIGGDSGSLVVNNKMNVIGIIHSNINNKYNLASKSKYIKKSIANSNIKFKKFITQKLTNMIQKVRVIIGEKNHYQLLGRIKEEDGNEVLKEILGVFYDWNGNHSKKLKIVENDFEKEEESFIFDARFVNIDDCSKDEKCKELQLLASPIESKKNKILSIDCDFGIDNINVVLLKFSKDELDSGSHLDPACSSCYPKNMLMKLEKKDLVKYILNKNFDPIPIPTVKKGNILRGI